MQNHRLVLDKERVEELITYILTQNKSHLEDLLPIGSSLKGESATIFAQALNYYMSGNEALTQVLTIFKKGTY